MLNVDLPLDESSALRESLEIQENTLRTAFLTFDDFLEDHIPEKASKPRWTTPRGIPTRDLRSRTTPRTAEAVHRPPPHLDGLDLPGNFLIYIFSIFNENLWVRSDLAANNIATKSERGPYEKPWIWWQKTTVDKISPLSNITHFSQYLIFIDSFHLPKSRLLKTRPAKTRVNKCHIERIKDHIFFFPRKDALFFLWVEFWEVCFRDSELCATSDIPVISPEQIDVLSSHRLGKGTYGNVVRARYRPNTQAEWR